MCLAESSPKLRVLRRVDFHLKQGSIFALFCSNGAGAFSCLVIFLPFINSAFVFTRTIN